MALGVIMTSYAQKTYYYIQGKKQDLTLDTTKVNFTASEDFDYTALDSKSFKLHHLYRYPVGDSTILFGKLPIEIQKKQPFFPKHNSAFKILYFYRLKICK